MREKCIEKLGIIADELDVIVPKGVVIAAQKRENEIVNLETLMENHHAGEELYRIPYDAPEDIASGADHIFHNEVRQYHI